MTTLAQALVEAQKKMPALEKDATNPHFHSRFVSLNQLIAKTRPVLNDHGLAIVQFGTTTELGQPALKTIIVHAESGEQLSADMPLFLGKQDMQGLGAAITYARRYAWASALGIASEEDDDGNSAVSSGGSASSPASAPGTMPFGKHKGLPFSEVPAEYLDWVLKDSKDQAVKDAITTWRLTQEAPLPAEDDVPF